jgi:hypothetical protein
MTVPSQIATSPTGRAKALSRICLRRDVNLLEASTEVLALVASTTCPMLVASVVVPVAANQPSSRMMAKSATLATGSARVRFLQLQGLARLSEMVVDYEIRAR